MLKKILAVIAVLILVLVVIVALQPADFRIERKTVILAPAAAAFARVNDFHQWDAWSPWAKLDPTMKVTYNAVPSGTGAGYAWTGDSKVGEGRMTITDSNPGALVRIKLEFLKPFAAVNTTDFVFAPSGNQTEVTWSMVGRNNFMAKGAGLFMNMDKMVGGDFERGLAQLKAVTESGLPK